jgi:hypothetical protein
MKYIAKEILKKFGVDKEILKEVPNSNGWLLEMEDGHAALWVDEAEGKFCLVYFGPSMTAKLETISITN